MVIIPPFLAMEIQALHGAHKKRAVNRSHFCKQLETPVFYFFFLEILDKSGYWQQKGPFLFI